MQPEARLGHQIRAALTERGAFAFKVHGSALMMAGLPDLIVCYRGRFMSFEVKMPGNRATPVQKRTHQKIRAAGGLVAVVFSVDEALSLLDAVDQMLDRT